MRLLFAVGLTLAVVAGAQSRLSFLHTPPTEATPGEPLSLDGSLAGGDASKVIVHVRGPGEPWEEYSLELQYGDLYRGALPASRLLPPGIEYWIEAVTSTGERVPIFATAKQPVRVIVLGDAPAPVAEPPKPKCKKGKKCKDEPPPPEPTPAPEPVVEKKKEKPSEWVDAEKPADKPAEKKPEPEPAPVAKKKEPEPVREAAPPPRKQNKPQSELEEELALYGAEATGGVAQRVDEKTRVSPLAPTVLTNKQLRELGVRYVHEALDLVPGLSVSRDVQGNWRVAMRGLRSDAELLFTLNGQKLNNFYDGAALANLPIDNLDRIEVYRGPATADIGLGNVTGVINLVTRRDDGFRASASAGLYETFDGHLNGALTIGAVKLLADVDVASQRGQRKSVFRDGLDSATVQRPKLTSDKRLLINAGLGVELDLESAGVIDATGRFVYESRSALIGLFDVVGPDSQLEWLTVQAQAGWKKPLDNGGFISVRAFFDQQATNRLWQLAPDGWQVRTGDPTSIFADGVLEQQNIGVRGFGVQGRGEFNLPFSNRLAVGVQVDQQSIYAASLLANSEPITNNNLGELQRPDGIRLPTEDGKGGRGPAADRFNAGLWVYDTWTPVDFVSVQGGVRVDFTQLPRGDERGQWLASTVVPSFGPRIGITVTPIRSLVLRANYGRSFRAPTPQEFAATVPNNDFNQGRFVGNPQLQGAYIDAAEAGAEYLQGLGEGKLRLRGTFFFERISNAIVQVDTSGNLVPYANRPLGVQALGLEGEARLELTSRMNFWLNASWVRPEDLTAPTQSRILTDVPQIRANGGASLPLGPWLNLDFVARFASERRNNSRSVLELIRRYTLPGYATFTAQLRTEPLFDHLELVVLGQNVFNFEYADDATRPDRVTNGVPRESWNVFAQARVGF
ncbi:MAG: TonB-dependent receptor domain-containing protein [Archangium sp.]